MAGAATPSAKRAMKAAGAKPRTEIESAVVDAKNPISKPNGEGRVYFATVGGAAIGITHQGKTYHRSNKRDFDPYTSVMPNDSYR